MRAGPLALAALALAGCGGARVAHAARPVRGVVRYCADSSFERPAATTFNRAHAGQGLSVRLTVFRSSARVAAAVGRGECDVVELDADEVPRWAAAGTLRDITAHVRARRGEFVPATLRSGHYSRRDWALPLYAIAGLLYARAYPLPHTLQALYRRGGFLYGDGPDSALAFYETAYAAGGRVLSPDGRHGALDSAPNRAALSLLVSAATHGRVTGAPATRAYRRFLDGHGRFMRNWTSFAGDPELADMTQGITVAPLPPFAGGHPATLLLGRDLAVTRTARDVPAALAFIDARTSVAGEHRGARNGYLPTLARSYGPGELQNVLGGSRSARALRQAVTLPVTPHSDEITQVLQGVMDAALSRRMPVARALRRGDRAIDEILANDAPGGEA
jgi:multiple sugar transport system substrate-binding protein